MGNRTRVVAGLAALTMLGTGLAAPAHADDDPSDPPGLIASFDFEQAGAPFDGGAALATTKGTATLADGPTGKAAVLGSGFWLDVTKQDGTPLLAGLNEVTISYDSLPNASGNTGWSVFAARSAATQTFQQEHYLGFLDKTTGITVERYDNYGTRNSAGNIVYTATNTQWKHVDLVVSGQTARLYVNQQLVGVNTAGKTLTEILTAGGGVFQVGKANWGSGGEYFSGQLDNLKVYSRALSGAELGVPGATADPVAALAIPSRITGDLPSSVLGHAVTWSATGPGASRVAADGSVTLPAAGDGPVSATVTATIDGIAEPISAAVQILDAGGEVATYVKKVTTTGGVKDDPLAYNDDRRADALHLSARAAGDEAWEALNRSQPILYVTWNGTQSANPNAQMGSPTLLRFADGKLGAVAAQNNATDSVYVWDSPDGVTFRNQRTVKVTTDGSIVSDPRIVYDAATQAYKVFWKDIATGEGRVATLSALTAQATPSAATAADARVLGVAGIPAFAAQNEASTFALSADEYDALYRYYVDLRNTGVVAPSPVEVATGSALSAGDLPGTVTMQYNDGSTKDMPVVWDEDQLAEVDTSQPGTFEIQGAVQQVTQQMVNDARADPHLFFNEDDGYWYLTGSHYAVPSDAPNDQLTSANSYRKIGLKRATTIEGLAAAEEQIVIDPDAGTPGLESQYPNTFYGWGAYIWAQEFHKINGRWWIIAGMNWGYSANGDWCDNTVLIPFTGSEEALQAGGLVDPENWGQPTILEGAAFDVSYFEREENGTTQGYWIMPRSAKLWIGKVAKGDGVTPLLDGPLTEIYSITQPWEYGKQAPTPSDTNEGSDQAIIEAPYMFEHDGYIYITYSGATVDKYYTLGLMRAAADADLQNPASWTKVSYPVLIANDTFDGRIGGEGHAGPGHNSFAIDEHGNIVLAYHARPYPEQHTGNAAGGLFDPDRNSWFKGVNVRANGMIDLTLTADQEVAPANRTVSVTVVVAGEGQEPPVTVSAVTRCVAGKVVQAVSVTNQGDATTTASVTSPYGSKTLSLGAGATASAAFTTRQVSIPAGELQVSAPVAGGQPYVADVAFAAANCG